jgi:hypothetical protein
MNPRPTLALLAVPLACLFLTACGGGQAAPSTPAEGIPHWLGKQLVGRASAVEASLSRNDQCTALSQVTQLEQAEATAIADGHIPTELQAPLLSSTRTLAGQITCTPPKPPKPPGHDHHHHHPKHGDGQGD